MTSFLVKIFIDWGRRNPTPDSKAKAREAAKRIAGLKTKNIARVIISLLLINLHQGRIKDRERILRNLLLEKNNKVIQGIIREDQAEAGVKHIALMQETPGFAGLTQNIF